MVKRTPAYKNKLKALELERTGAMSSKKKGGHKIDKYETILVQYIIIVFSKNFKEKIIVIIIISYMTGKCRKTLARNLNCR